MKWDARTVRLFSEGQGGAPRGGWDGTELGCPARGAVYDGGDQAGGSRRVSVGEGLATARFSSSFRFSFTSLPVSLLAEERNGEKRTRFGEWRTVYRFAVKSRFLEEKNVKSHCPKFDMRNQNCVVLFHIEHQTLVPGPGGGDLLSGLLCKVRIL